MRVMKKTFSFMFLLAGMFLLSSCSNDDDPVSPDSETPIWYRGYFEGEVGGIPVSIQDKESSEELIEIVGYDNWVDHLKSCGGMTASIRCGEKYVLLLDFYRPVTGFYYFTDSGRIPTLDEQPHQGGIYLILADAPSPKDYLYYEPTPEHPFRVEIINAHYEDLMPPLIEAEFSGTLYRKDNPNDSIVVKGKFSHTMW